MKEKIGFASSRLVQTVWQMPWATNRAPSLKVCASFAALASAWNPAGLSEIMSFAAFSCEGNGGNGEVDEPFVEVCRGRGGVGSN